MNHPDHFSTFCVFKGVYMELNKSELYYNLLFKLQFDLYTDFMT